MSEDRRPPAKVPFQSFFMLMTIQSLDVVSQHFSDPRS
jgi:hypothetical protein